MTFKVRRGAYVAAWVFALVGAGTSGCGSTVRNFGSESAGSAGISAGAAGGGSGGAPAKAGAAGVAAGAMPGTTGEPGGASGVGGASGGDASGLGGADGLGGAGVNGLGGSSLAGSGGSIGQTATSGGGPTTSGGMGSTPPAPCGNGALDAGETCDDGNAVANDGCSATCQVEAHWQCKPGVPSACAPVCGDGFVVGTEAKAGGCDDHNQLAGDGCSATCTVEASYFCKGAPSVCAKTCGNGTLESGEACDDGNSVKGDGCFSCAIETGFSCGTAVPTKCTLIDQCATLKPCTGNTQCMNTTPGNYSCVCTPTTMASACTGKCGMVSNSCTGTYTCAGCSAPQTCGGGGTMNVCGCTPTPMGSACSGKCGSVANGCGGTYTCAGCSAPQTCGGGGTASVCGCTPTPMASACSGKCGSVANGCGGTYTCSTCTAGANAIATCQSNQCVNSCAPGVLPLACPNAPANQALCAAWDFETNTLEGWGLGDPSDAGITAKTTLAVSTTRHFSGTHALVVNTTIPGGEDANGGLQQLLTLEAPLCSDISSINLLNRLFKINAYFEYVSGSHLTAPNASFTGGSHTQTGGDSVGSVPFTVVEGQWLSGSAQLSISATHLNITIGVGTALPTPWQGRVYLDGLSVQ